MLGSFFIGTPLPFILQRSAVAPDKPLEGPIHPRRAGSTLPAVDHKAHSLCHALPRARIGSLCTHPNPAFTRSASRSELILCRLERGLATWRFSIVVPLSPH